MEFCQGQIDHYWPAMRTDKGILGGEQIVNQRIHLSEVQWIASFKEVEIDLEILADGRLLVNTHTHFTDNSGREDYDSTYYFILSGSD